MSEPSAASAAIVVVGNEVLSAKVHDENSPFLLERFRRLGVRVVRVLVVPDRHEVLVETYRAVCKLATWVISTGGVGPTHDDVTMAAVAEAFDRKLVTDATLEGLIREYFQERVNEYHLQMARIPEGTELTWGSQLRFPVVRVENLFVLPGSPGLVRSKFLGIEERFRQTPFHLKRLFLKVEEAEVAALLAAAERGQEGVEVGSYPVTGIFDHRVEVTVEGKDLDRLEAAARHIREGLPPGVLVAEE